MEEATIPHTERLVINLSRPDDAIVLDYLMPFEENLWGEKAREVLKVGVGVFLELNSRITIQHIVSRIGHSLCQTTLLENLQEFSAGIRSCDVYGPHQSYPIV